MVLSCIQLSIDENLKRKEFSTDDFSFLMTKHTQQLQRMSEMIVEQRVGLIQVKAKDFHDSSLPYASHIIEAIGAYIPPVAIAKNERMQRTIRVRSRSDLRSFEVLFQRCLGRDQTTRSRSAIGGRIRATFSDIEQSQQ